MRREYRERFPHHRGLAIPTCITARAWRTTDIRNGAICLEISSVILDDKIDKKSWFEEPGTIKRYNGDQKVFSDEYTGRHLKVQLNENCNTGSGCKHIFFLKSYISVTQLQVSLPGPHLMLAVHVP